MLNNLSIELLKAKRTKSFFIIILVMGVGFAWAIAAATRYLSNPAMHQINLIFYMIKEVNGLILPIVISLFVSRIVKNEKEGNTFKLLLANGENVRHIFLSKLGLTMFVLTFLAILEGVVVQLIANFSGLEMPVSLILWQIVIFLLASFVLTCLFLTLQFLLKKQALILALGIFGGFLGVGFGHAPAFLQLIFPFGGIGYLSLVDYQQVASQVSYVLATNLGFKLFTYLPIALIYLFLSLYLVEKKGGKL